MAIKLAKIRVLAGSLFFLRSGETIFAVVNPKIVIPIMPVVAKIRIRLESGLEPPRLINVCSMSGKILFWA